MCSCLASRPAGSSRRSRSSNRAPALGYANNPGSESYKRLAATGPLWGDTHHPVLSQTDGRYDGHWLWINDKANDRVAKIDLRTFEVAGIKRVPNLQGAHGLAAYLPSCKYVFVNGELESDAAGNSTDPAQVSIGRGAFSMRRRWRRNSR